MCWMLLKVLKKFEEVKDMFIVMVFLLIEGDLYFIKLDETMCLVVVRSLNR